MLRIVHIREAFKPFYFPIDWIMSDTDNTKRENAKTLFALTLTSILFAHLTAAVWINIGLINETGDNISFIWNQRNNPDASDHAQWADYEWH